MTRFSETLYWIARTEDDILLSELNCRFSSLEGKKIKDFTLVSTNNKKEFNFIIGSKRKLIFARRNRITGSTKDVIVICGWYEGYNMRVMFIFPDGSYEIKEEWEENGIYSEVL